MSLLLRIAYDGTDFHGFARQPRRRTVQGVLEQHLETLYKQPVETRGASRTDAGVHARGQLVALEPPLEIPTQGVLRALWGLLPDDLAVVEVWSEAGPDGGPVQPRFHNLGKHYRYQIRCGTMGDPFGARYRWRVLRALDVDAMSAAAELFVGEHDFAGFRAQDCEAATTTRRVTQVRVTTERVAWRVADVERATGTDVSIDVLGEGFLKRMVRIMVGTLVEIGQGRRDPQTIPEALQGGDRRAAGRTAPGRGLTLVEVRWPGRRAAAER